jgi:hypothetical protein
LHPFTLCFYIIFGLVMFFLSWIIYWINLSLDFIPWHFISISNMVLIFLLLFLVLIFFLIEIVFQFHPLWFFNVKFGSFSFQIYIFLKIIISFLSLIILVDLEFYIVFFFFFAFYVEIQPHDLCHKFWKLNRVQFSYF